MEKKLFAVAAILLLSLSIFAVIHVEVAHAASILAFQDAEMATKFNEGWGPATVVITDIAGPGVRFDYTGLTGSGTAKCDGYPIDSLAGGLDDGHGGYGDFSGYTQYTLRFTNVGSSAVTVNLFMNTGFAADGTGYDTYWECSWVGVPAGESRVVTLDFSAAITYGAMDDPVPAWRQPDTTVNPVQRLNHVSKIGFQVLGSGAGSVIVSNQYDAVPLLIDPQLTTKYYGVDSFFDVYVKIDSVTDLYGLDIDIRWDNALMTYKEEDYTTYLNAMWGAGSWMVTKHENGVVAGEGYYKFVAVCTHVPPGFSTSGSQVIFKLSFNVIDPETNSKKTGPIHFATDKLSDSSAQPISHTAYDGIYEIWGTTPTLSMTCAGGSSRTCRELNEQFVVTIGITGAVSITDFNFEIDYDSAMLDYVTMTAPWGSGTITEGPSGTLIGTTNSITGPQTGTITLVTITFKSDPAFMQKWKDPSTGQTSNLFASSIGIYLQSATLKFLSPQPDLTYLRNEPLPHKINPPSDISYTFSPIKGDLNNDGRVNVDDLNALATRYDTPDADYNLVGSDTLVDIFDLVIVASNFWFTYP